jgi:hypothetical protein
MKRTLKEIWMAGERAIILGHAWRVELTIRGDMLLTREIKVKAHIAIGGLKGGGLRTIAIRRPADTMAESQPARAAYGINI